MLNLLAFARATGRRVEWLLVGEGPEFVGELVRRHDLAVAFAAHVVAACEVEIAARRTVLPPFGSQPWDADAPALLREVTRHIVTTAVDETERHQLTASVMRPVAELATLARDDADASAQAKVSALVRQIGERSTRGPLLRTFAVGPAEAPPLPIRRKSRR